MYVSVEYCSKLMNMVTKEIGGPACMCVYVCMYTCVYQQEVSHLT